MELKAQSMGNVNTSSGNILYQPPTENAAGWVNGQKSMVSKAQVLIYVQPTAWFIELNAWEEALTTEACRQKLQVRIDGLLRKLQAQNIPSSDVLISTIGQERITAYRSDRYGNQTEYTSGYNLQKSIRIKYKTQEQYPAVLSAASEYGLDNVTQQYCTVDDEQAIYAELYRQAMAVVMQKRMEQADFYTATMLPDWKVTTERYNAVQPSPNAVPVGSVRQSNAGYDIVLNPEMANGAVQYTLYLELNYVLQKNPNPNTIKTR